MSTRYCALGAAVLGLALTLPCRSAAPPDTMTGMAGQPMSALMAMDDSAAVGKVLIEQLEVQGVAAGSAAGTAPAWEAQAWYGGDYDKVWLKSAGSPEPGTPGTPDASRNELLWDHVLTRWWDLQAGVRYDLGAGPARGWATVGVEGLAPYWFEVQAALYLGKAGRTAARVQIEHDLLITQRWIVQPQIETDFYGRRDAARDVAPGLSDLQVGLRLRYEIRRELAPYVGVAWCREAGASHPASLRWVAGLRTWF